MNNYEMEMVITGLDIKQATERPECSNLVEWDDCESLQLTMTMTSHKANIVQTISPRISTLIIL